ncbi:MAG: ChbG/HpnK family deacetylase [Acidobacteria bacterium]|nr:ChbG/HpnK family deacetylase [Acidobacteriota bacterium]
MPVKLIINADDFGFSPGVNRGIIECIERGYLKSATIMVNTPGANEALEYARGHPELGFGLHFNIGWGRPVCGRAPSISGSDGAFLRPRRLIPRILAHAVDPDDVAREAAAQIQRCLEAGVKLTHIDSHQHFHVFRPVYEGLLKAASVHGIRSFRLPMDILTRESRSSWKARLLRVLSRGLASRLKQDGLWHPDRFYGSAMMGAAFTRHHLASVIRGMPAQTTVEVMVHPGRPEPDFRKIDPYVEWREVEIEVLGSAEIREAIDASGAIVSDFRAL